MGLGLIFPGQGSQQVGMGGDFLANHAVAKQTFEEANDALGFDLRKLCQEGPEDELTLTFNAQPAILTVSTIAYRLLSDRAEVKPIAMAGHSLGEYSALVAAGALPFAEAVRIVNQRGKFMQEATPVGVGAMAAILGMEAAELEQLCQDEAQGEVVAPANYNTPGQIVISGDSAAVLRVLEKCKGKQLPVSAPFHSSLMAPAAEQMKAVLEGANFSNAISPICTNTDNSFLTEASAFAANLVRQITSPVRWDTGVQAMAAKGIDQFVELGHGKVLAGMNKRIDKALATQNIFDENSLGETVKACFE